MPKTKHYSVREAVVEDQFEVVLLGREAYEDIINKDLYSYSPKKVAALVERMVESDDFLIIVLEDEYELVGYFFAMISPCFFSVETQALCLSWFIRPEHRGLKNAFSLLKTYEKWGKDKEAKVLNIGEIRHHSPKMWKKLGYKMDEIMYTKEVN